MSSKDSSSRVIRHLLFALLALVLVTIVGTLGYRILGGEQYSWVDCFYMTFITISTIGYIEAVDVTQYEYGRLFTVFIGITGIGVMGYVLSTVTAFMLEGDLNVSWRRKKMQKKIAGLKNHYIICGIGFIGSNVANELAAAGRESVVIDPDMASIERFLEAHPEQMYVCGDATDDSVLAEAGIMQARGLFAVVRDDSQNLMISLGARQINPGLNIVARCHDLKNVQKIRKAGADEVISPDYTGGLRIVSAMLRPNITSFLDDLQRSDSELRMEEILIPSTLAGRPLQELYADGKHCTVLALRQRGEWRFNPSPVQPMSDGDVLMVMTTAQGRHRLEQLMLGVAP